MAEIEDSASVYGPAYPLRAMLVKRDVPTSKEKRHSFVKTLSFWPTFYRPSLLFSAQHIKLPKGKRRKY
jgi:hypothetical protein